MALRPWLHPAQCVRVVFLAIAVALVRALAGRGWRFLDQDRALERQCVRGRLEHAADRIAAALGRWSAEAQEVLTRLSASAEAGVSSAWARPALELGPDALPAILTPKGVEAFPAMDVAPHAWRRRRRHGAGGVTQALGAGTTHAQSGRRPGQGSRGFATDRMVREDSAPGHEEGPMTPGGSRCAA